MATDTTKNQSWVQKKPGVHGGRACIRNTRITVWGVVNSRRLGAADEQILDNIIGLTAADLHAAYLVDYHRAHAARAELCRRSGKMSDAKNSFERAPSLARQQPKRRSLIRRLPEIEF